MKRGAKGSLILLVKLAIEGLYAYNVTMRNLMAPATIGVDVTNVLRISFSSSLELRFGYFLLDMQSMCFVSKEL